MSFCSTCSKCTNEEIFDDNNLYHYCVCERHKLCKYVKKHLKFLRSNVLRTMFVRLCKENKCTPYDILQGKLGGKQNERLKISFFPTYELLDNILSLCKETKITKIEEIAAGVGFHKELLNELRITKQCYRVDTISASDGFYEEDTANRIFCTVNKKDLADYIVAENFDTNVCYMVFNLDNYTSLHTDFDNELQTLLKWKKPQMLVVINEHININVTDAYTTFDFYPNVISKYDDHILIEEGQTELKGKIFIKNDTAFDVSIFEKLIIDGCQPVVKPASYVFRCMINNQLAPEWMHSLPEEKLLEYVRTINETQMQKLPLFLEENNIDMYMMLAQSFRANMETKKLVPIATKEKFNFLCSYLDLTMSDQGLKYLHENGSIPTHITDPFVAYMFLICDYFS